MMFGMNLSLPTSASVLSDWRPTPPDGYVFVTDQSGAYIVDSEGYYLVEAI